MGIETLLLAAMGIVLLSWVIFCGIQFLRNSRDVAIDLNFVGHVKCEKCGTEYEVSAKELSKIAIVKSKSITKTKRQGAALIDRPQYSYYAKKFMCPHCGKREYAQVLNINELNQANTKPMVRTGLRWLAYMVIGGLVILMVFSIPLYFSYQARTERIEDLRQQQYQDLKDRYGI